MLELADGRELRFRDIRKFGKVGLYPRDPASGELVTEAGGPAVFAGHGPEPLDPAFTLAAFRAGLRRRKGRLKPLLLDQSFIAGIGNIYADEALWTARLHPLRTAGSLRPPDERRLYAAIRSDPGRGGRAAGLVDRRLHGPRRRRRDAGATQRLPADRPALPALRSADPADRDRRPRDALLLVVPAVVGSRSEGRAADRRRRRILATLDRTRRGHPGGGRAGPSWPLTGPRTDRGRGRPGRGTGANRADQAGGGGSAGEGAGRHDRAGAGAERVMSLLRLDRVSREIGTLVILDEVSAAVALGERIGLSGRTGPARRPCSGSRPASTSRTAARSCASAG